MASWQQRTALLLGEQTLQKLRCQTIAVVGLGGVGGAAAEALCRTGIGHLILMDYDIVSDTNRNRQIFATTSTVGMSKCRAAEQRLHQVNPDCCLTLLPLRYDPVNAKKLFDSKPNVIIDAVDMVSAKLHLAEECAKRNLPLLMCLGTGNRFNPGCFQMGTIEATAGCGCPLARIMRRELRRRNLTQQRVLFSNEPPLRLVADQENGRHAPASSPFCPPVAGYLLAAEAVRILIEQGNEKDPLGKTV